MPEGSPIRVDARGFIVWQPVGLLTDEIATESSRQIRDMVEFQDGMPLLIDLTETTSLKVTTDEVVALAKSAQKDTNRVALIAPDATAYGMARMYEIIADLTDVRVGVYRDEASAISWLLP